MADHDACGVGFIAQLSGRAAHDVIDRALIALLRLSHRGGVDADGCSGDGAGLLTAIPDKFMRSQARQAGIHLPRQYGLGMVFLRRGREEEGAAVLEEAVREQGLRLAGWREVPTDASVLGSRALTTLPEIRQCFVTPARRVSDLERRLFLLRKRIESRASPDVYLCSLSSRTVVYKGLLTPGQLASFYADLASPQFETPFAIFHQRYSTNTRPSWSLAQPFRYIAHNGEINTIVANRRWLWARVESLRRHFGAGECFEVLEKNVSDSASFDNGLELLLHQDFSAAAAMLRMVPPAWEHDARLPARLKTFLDAQSREQEPWDGPGAFVFTDGRMVGAKLDRNGLRPFRYAVTRDGLVVAGSEVGIADLADEAVIERQRLGPGEMLIADPARQKLYRGTSVTQCVRCPSPARVLPRSAIVNPSETIATAQTAEPKRVAAALGWTEDQYRLLFQPAVKDGKEAIWSMGDDAPPAFLSAARRPLWDYCKQRFAQVTNPPIDPMRERFVMSLTAHLGRTLEAPSPLLDGGQLQRVETLLTPVRRIDITFPAQQGVEGGLAVLSRLQALGRDRDGRKLGTVILSDAGVCDDRAVVPVLLAVSAVWKAMVDSKLSDVPLIVESGQAFDTHHIALLIAAGASAVHPYLAFEFAAGLHSDGCSQYRKAIELGLLKVLARMGISTLSSYRNSQLFETIGLDREVSAEFFEDAPSYLGGRSLRDLLEDALANHAAAFHPQSAGTRDAGLYRFRREGEQHGNSPELVRRMHAFIKSPTTPNYENFAELSESRAPVAIRDFLDFAKADAIALDSVEHEPAILTRFSTQAMSLGAISPEAHRAVAIAMNRLNARSNTGEGGEDPSLYYEQPDAANRVKQVASARFGVTAEYLQNAAEIEIKMAQGSKPGEGGQLPASKVTPYIARLRHAVPGMSLISPPPHHDIYSIEDLAQLIFDLRAVNPQARIGVKLVSGAGVGIIAAGVAKAGADVITISGFDGGTGASPLTSIKNTGLPWEVGLREAHCALVQSGFRRRVRLRVDGGLKFGRDVVVAALLGADEFGFGTAALLAIGCVMARQCHLNTCPVGIATQDEHLRTRFNGKPEMVVSYFRGVAAEVREILASLGARSLEEIVGDVGRLSARHEAAGKWLSPLLRTVEEGPQEFPVIPEIEAGVNGDLARIAEELEALQETPRRFAITNADRSVGAHFGAEVMRRNRLLKVDIGDIDCEFHGVAGQSFGAFLTQGVRFRLQGEANDYVGKGLSGGVIAISAGPEASRRGDVLAGNTVLYGATGGELYIAGRAGERFAVRNSGALAVTEGVGQHGCEYMTAGVVVLLGPAGVNLASGMTGGLLYALRDAPTPYQWNHEFVSATSVGSEEEAWLRRVLRQHFRLTGSPKAGRLLSARSKLPLIRLQPLHLPCPVEQTWAPLLKRFERHSIELPVPDTQGSQSFVM